MSGNPAALQLRYMQTLLELGGSRQTSTIVFPIPIDLLGPLLSTAQEAAPARERSSEQPLPREFTSDEPPDGELALNHRPPKELAPEEPQPEQLEPAARPRNDLTPRKPLPKQSHRDARG